MTPRRAKQSIAPEDEFPEADRLDGFPHPRHTAQLFGHAGAETSIASQFADGHMHHAWLISGPNGIGKATLAYRIARYVLANPAERQNSLLAEPDLTTDPESRTSKQVRALSHTGLLVIRRAYDLKSKRIPTQIGVDEVRRLRGFLTQTAATDAWRVVIVDAAEEMTVSAANALLKSLEEPPRRMLFLIVSSAPGRLLPTIHSRCRTMKLLSLSEPELRAAVTAARGAAASADDPEGEPELLPDKTWALVVGLAGGSPRRALQLLADDGATLHNDISAILVGLPRVNRSSVLRLADRLSGGQAAAQFEMFFDLLVGTIASAVRTASGAQITTSNMAATALAARLDAPQKVARWAALWETLLREKAEADTLNLDRRTLIVETFLRIEATARDEVR